VFLCVASILFPRCLSASRSEVAELLQTLKWAHRCLPDAQSQQDVELIMQLLTKEDFKNAYSIYMAVSRVIPTSALTGQAEDLCQEVPETVILKPLKTNMLWKHFDFTAVLKVLESSRVASLSVHVHVIYPAAS